MSLSSRGRAARRALVTVPVLAVALAACGDSAGVAPDAYVKSICIALGNWKNEVQTAGSKLQASGAARASPRAAKRDYVQFVAGLQAATRRAARALAGGGFPAVTDGQKIASDLADAFARGADGLEQAKSEAQAIPTANATQFEAGAGSVSAQIKTSLEGIAAITPRSSTPLRVAASRERACRVLSSSH